jgi:hypothetical protein
MKKLLLLSFFMFATAASAQYTNGLQLKTEEKPLAFSDNMPDVLSVAVKQVFKKPEVSPFSVGVSMYGTPYRNIFSFYYEVTGDRTNYGFYTIYVGHNDRLYYNGYRPIIISMPGAGIDLDNINYFGPGCR